MRLDDFRLPLALIAPQVAYAGGQLYAGSPWVSWFMLFASSLMATIAILRTDGAWGQ